MAFNHDNFINSANYRQLDALLDWYIATVDASKRATLESLMKKNPTKLKALYQRDPVMQKFRKIGRYIHDFTVEADIGQ